MGVGAGAGDLRADVQRPSTHQVAQHAADGDRHAEARRDGGMQPLWCRDSKPIGLGVSSGPGETAIRRSRDPESAPRTARHALLSSDDRESGERDGLERVLEQRRRATARARVGRLHRERPACLRRLERR
jgi:hypothetical protein